MFVLRSSRSLSEVYSNKKSSLKVLVDCFPRLSRSYSSVEPLTLMMALPASTTQGLTHEQVMPFLKKMESGSNEKVVWL